MKASLVAILTLTLCGCASVEYTDYSGQQQNWAVASGSFVQRQFALPVYINGPPDRPYNVLGYIQVENAPTGLLRKSESIKSAVKEAAKHGADGMILLESGTDVAGVYSTSSAFGTAQAYGGTAYSSGFGFGTSVPIRKGHARAIAIKFI